MKLVDTSGWIEYLRATGSPVDHEVTTLLGNDDAAWCDMIALELINYSSFSQESRLQKIRRLAWTLDINPDVWQIARSVASAARRSGITAPLPDYVIFACAKVYELEILHKGDSDFGRLEQVFSGL